MLEDANPKWIGEILIICRRDFEEYYENLKPLDDDF